MKTTFFSSREFNQEAGRAKKAAHAGPVFITERGRPAHVLLTIEDYRRITGKRKSIAEMLATPGAEDIELEVPARTGTVRAADLS